VTVFGIEAPLRAADQIADELRAVLVGDADRVAVGASAAARIDKGPVVDAAEQVLDGRQFKRTAGLDRLLDQGVVEKAGQVLAKLGVPFACCRGRIGGALGGDGALAQGRIEGAGRALHDQHFRVVLPEVVAVLLMQQPQFSIRSRDADQHPVCRG
jgi:hypothetical protein